MITNKLNYKPLLRGHSNNALAQLSASSFPSRKQEEWKYAPLKKLKKIPFINHSEFNVTNLKSLNLPKMSGITIVLENGKFNSKISKSFPIKGLEISFISNSKENYPISNKIQENNYFSLLNSSYLTEGIVLRVSPGFIIEETINIINISSTNNCLINTKLDVLLSKNTSLKIKKYFLGRSSSINAFINHISNFTILQNASLVVDKFQDLNQNFNISNESINQDSSSTYISNTFTKSGLFTRNNIINNVKGENSHSELNGIFTPSKNEHIDNHTLINHLVPNCQSYENYKGIIQGNGVGVFNGKVIVHENAQKIEAYQKNNNILLDHDSVIYSKPELEIYADDVKCSHGSTTGQFNLDSIFYLRSRGISLKKAKELMILGFINEVVQKCNDTDFQDFIVESLLKN